MANFGYFFRGKVEDFDTTLKLGKEFITVTQKGASKIAMDTAPMNAYLVGAADRVAETGSTDSRIKLTGHDIKVGDIIRLKTTINAINELEIGVKEVIDADNIELAGVLSGSISNTDTFDILRPITPRVDETGASLASVISPPIKINVTSGAVTTETTVLDDQDTPANTVPIPVRLYGVTGNINITSEDLNVQLSHSAASPDSVKIGNGTNLLAVNASLEAQVRDDDAIVELTAIKGLDFATETTLALLNAKFAALGQGNMAGSVPVVIASDQSALNITNISGTISLPTGASTAAHQVTAQTTLTSLDGKDFATQTTLATIDGKLTSLGTKASAGSMPVVLSTEQNVIIDAIKTAVEIIDNAISGNEMQVDLVDLGGAATEATLAAQSAKLPAALGQANKAGSLSVTIANDQDAVNTALAVKDFLDSGLLDTDSTNIATTGTQVVASLAANVKKIQIFEDIGEYMSLRNGAGTVLAYLPIGGGDVEVAIASGTELKLYSEKGSAISSGKIAVNFIG